MIDLRRTRGPFTSSINGMITLCDSNADSDPDTIDLRNGFFTHSAPIWIPPHCELPGVGSRNVKKTFRALFFRELYLFFFGGSKTVFAQCVSDTLTHQLWSIHTSVNVCVCICVCVKMITLCL